MQTAGLIFGILSIIGMLVGFIPCLGALNWLNIPFAVIGLIISAIGYSTSSKDEPNGKAIAGIVLCGFAALFGIIRLIAGGGLV